MLTIRLNRMGKNKRASFRVVVQEHTVAPGGRHVEILGSYDPHTKINTFKKDRIQYWISKGAQPSETVHNLLVKNAIIEGKKMTKKIPKPVVAEAPVEEAKAEEVAAPEAVAEVKEEAPAAEEKKEEAKVEVPVAEEAKTEEKPAE